MPDEFDVVAAHMRRIQEDSVALQGAAREIRARARRLRRYGNGSGPSEGAGELGEEGAVGRQLDSSTSKDPEQQ